MGQRSQIYVRYNGELIIANYYQWNYGDRMISRARHGIEYMVEAYLKQGFYFAFGDKGYIKKFRRYFDVNFDMQDIVMSSNIVKEYEEYYSDEDFCQACYYQQDNNDGKLFVDIVANKQDETFSIKYAFLDYDCNLDHIMSAADYMEWDEEGWRDSSYLVDELKKACEDNIAYLTSEIGLLSKDELIDFLNTDNYWRS